MKKNKINAALVGFLDLHSFSAIELADYNYIAEKISNYAENVGIRFSNGELKSLAKQYSKIKLQIL